jgi:UDP-glucose 4-epimerase
MAQGARTAVTGIASFLGARMLQRLAEREPAGQVLAIDVAAPPAGLDVRHHHVDLTEPASDQQMLDVLREERVRTVLHCAFFTTPRRDGTYAHELESIGTLNLLAACAAAGVEHVVLRSFTAVYGARGQNPNFLTEDRPLQPNPRLGWVRDKLEAEQHAASFARRYPDMRITILRFAPLLGPAVHTFYTRLLDHRVVPVLLGYDPLVQMLHPDDALEGMERALERRLPGAFNIVPSRPITLVTALHTAAKIPVPVPHPLACPAVDLLWAAGLSEAPGGFVDYARYLFVADGEKARAQLGFSARHSSRDALIAYLRYRHAAPQLWEAAATA